MANLPITIYGSPVLRQTAKPVPEITPEIRQLAEDMAQTMFEAPGIGLAAPQVGKSLRMFIIDPSFGEEPDGSYVAFINPVLSNHGGDDPLIEEGCLSIPDIRADVIRPETVSVDYTTLDGERAHIDADDLLSRVIQHEFDHLDGLMFVDRLTPLRRRSLDSELKAMARSQKKNRLR